MRRRLLLGTAGVAVLTLLGLGAGPQAVPDAAGVRAAEDGWIRAFATGDAAFLDALLDPAYVSVGTKANARTKPEIIALAVRRAAGRHGAQERAFQSELRVNAASDRAARERDSNWV